MKPQPFCISNKCLLLIYTVAFLFQTLMLQVTEAAADVLTELPASQSAPLDQAAQAAIQNSQMQKRVILRVRHVKLDVDSLKDQTSISLKLFAGQTLLLLLDRLNRTADGIINWIGHVGANQVDRVILTIKDKRLVGTVHYGALVYQIRPAKAQAEGIHAIYEIDQTLFPSESAHGRRRPVSLHPSSVESHAHAMTLPPYESSPFSATPVGLPNSKQIDLLVVYGNDVSGTASAIDLEAINAVEDANLTFELSGVALFLCLVDYVHVSGYSGSGSVEDDFNCLVYDLCSSVASQVATSKIRSEPKTNIVDLVSVWVEWGGGSYCGWAEPNEVLQPMFRYSVVQRAGPACPTSNYSMAHELGHSMGARHDRSEQGVQGLNNGKQNYGHFNNAAKQRTIMAEQDFCSGCARIGYWSNLLPSNSYKNGDKPMGSADPTKAANNAGTLEANKNTVANWRNPSASSCKLPPTPLPNITPAAPSAPTNLRVQ